MPQAHKYWLAGKRNDAIQAVLAVINASPKRIPHKPALQFAYYLAMMNDWAAAAKILVRVCETYPEDLEALLNLGVCQHRSRDYRRARVTLQKFISHNPDNPVAWDAMAPVCYKLNLLQDARAAGERSLLLKDAASKKPPPRTWTLPAGKPSAAARQAGKKHVISFSLWGNNIRYLRGALRNALLVHDIYRGWICRFYVDDSVPDELPGVLRDLGSEVINDTAQHPVSSDRERAARRFYVANDREVGYFLVRDCDSVIGVREAEAVEKWLASDKWFHVMRDWWTHTELVLGGMWGGVAGVLPDLRKMFDEYRSVHIETSNWDQWFLRDCVWPYIRTSCLVHDRYFQVPGVRPFPGTVPAGNYHVGQDEYAVNSELQGRILQSWIERIPCLR